MPAVAYGCRVTVATHPRGTARHHVPDPLRHDVKTLGGFLGQVLRESGIPGLYEDVEALRRLSIQAHEEPDGDALTQAEQLVAGLDHPRAEQVARAFTCYFHLVNLAEEHHRVRAMREREAQIEQADHTRPDDSAPAALEALIAEVGREEAERQLQRLEFRPVFTAHPTEARRRAVARSIRRAALLLAQRDSLVAAGLPLHENDQNLLVEVDTLWRTSPLRADKPSVLDEVNTVLAVVDQTMVDVLPAIYRKVDDWLLGDQAGTGQSIVKPFVRLGTWIGGDRDGNPNVTAEITRAAAVVAGEHALDSLIAAANRTALTLTLDGDGTPASSQLSALWRQQQALSDQLTSQIANIAPNEPHRRVMMVVAERLVATRRRDADMAYSNPQELESDLVIVQQSLVRAGARRAAHGELQKLLWLVRTFGFHLMEMEIRQHSQVHASALADIEANGIDGELTPTTIEVLDTFRAMGWVQRRYGTQGASRYIVSFTQSAEHLAAVYRLAEYAFAGAEAPAIDAIALFETFDDLNRAVDILNDSLQIPAVANRLHANERRMEVMLGYSDSSKDVGPVSATLALDAAQARIAQWAKDNNITLTLFHGRGGALGRGGGPANRALLAQPPGSVCGRFKLTEQGEVVFARYGDPDIAARHIEQIVAATLLQGSPAIQQRNAQAVERFADLSAQLDQVSRTKFHELVQTDGFPAWFAEVTPLEELGLLPLGSRPARRGLMVSSLADLRAIPWVFSWAQARMNLAGWYGLGSALAAVGDVEKLRTAYAEWPLFNTIIDNVEMSLAKTDERIAARYLGLGDRPDLAELILNELRLTRQWILATTGEDGVLERRRVLGRAVQLRAPYVDALSLLQLRALQALRTGNGDQPSDNLHRLLLLSVNGVAAGLQNTG